MTDLTPEQIKQWAKDATAKRHHARQLKATLKRVNLGTLLDDTDLARLHAHARYVEAADRIEADADRIANLERQLQEAQKEATEFKAAFSDADQLRSDHLCQLAEAQEARDKAIGYLRRHFNEVPMGHHPHMMWEVEGFLAAQQENQNDHQAEPHRLRPDD